MCCNIDQFPKYQQHYVFNAIPVWLCNSLVVWWHLVYGLRVRMPTYKSQYAMLMNASRPGVEMLKKTNDSEMYDCLGDDDGGLRENTTKTSSTRQEECINFRMRLIVRDKAVLFLCLSQAWGAPFVLRSICIWFGWVIIFLWLTLQFEYINHSVYNECISDSQILSIRNSGKNCAKMILIGIVNLYKLNHIF